MINFRWGIDQFGVCGFDEQHLFALTFADKKCEGVQFNAMKKKKISIKITRKKSK